MLGVLAGPAGAAADGLLSGFGQAEPALPYRAATFPPQEDSSRFSPPARDLYRQAQAPATPGQYGGGFIELLMTGQAGGPAAPASGGPAYAAPAPRPVYNPDRAALPQGSLPDYAPQPDAYYGHPAQAQAQASYDPLRSDPGLARRPIDPVFQRQEVSYSGRERAGTIIIDTPEKFLFLIQPGGRALRYGIGVGRPGFAWSGVKSVSRKAEWPDWTPPPEMLLRRPDLPRHMAGGPANPLGARALYLGSSLYRIHGTNEPYTIGTNVSSGCIRMMNEDVVDLYGRVGVGTRVIVM